MNVSFLQRVFYTHKADVESRLARLEKVLADDLKAMADKETAAATEAAAKAQPTT